MPAYAVGTFHQMSVNRQLVGYLKKIDTTLVPFEGKFLVHGKQGEVVEGSFSGYCIIIEFPNLDKARAWYHSEAYQKIISLRKENSEGNVMLIDGVPENYQASDLLRR